MSTLLIYCTCPDHTTAQNIATNLVAKNLAACVNIVPQIQSVYRWEGEVISGTEALLMIKTIDSNYSLIETAILQQHPYKVPEIIAMPIVVGEEKYLQWIEENSNEV